MKIYYSNRLETLSEHFAASLAQSPTGVFNKELVITQIEGMGKYLTLDCAARNGISSGLQFMTPAAFVREAAPLLLGREYNVPEKISLAWIIFTLIERGLADDPSFAPIKNYYNGDRVKLLQLSARIGDIFDQYSLYRSDMVNEWEQQESHRNCSIRPIADSEIWQHTLWRKIFNDGGFSHRGRIIADFMKSPQGEADLPWRRITFFGVSYLPQYVIRFATRLAQILPITIYAESPCSEQWWFDYKESVILKKELSGVDTQSEYYATGHPLLTSLGTPGSEFRNLMERAAEGTDIDDDALYEDPEGDSLLAHIQRSILHNNFNDGEKISVDDTDRSVSFHAAYSPMRECEILRDHILEAIEAGASPREIIVMSPDIDAYSPFIEAVFGSAEDEHLMIPYSVADRSTKSISPIVKAVRILLLIDAHQYNAALFIDLLTLDAVRRRFHLSADDAEKISEFIISSGALWGLDAGQRKKESGVSYEKFSWKYAFNRLLSGYACAKNDTLFRGVAPMASVAPHDAPLLESLSRIFDAVTGFSATMEKEATAREYFTIIKDGIDALIDPEDDERDVYRSVVGTLDMVCEALEKANLADEPIEPALFLYEFSRQLDFDVSKRGFMDGRVTFCKMLPMRSVPFQMVALIGMNMSDFPRADTISAFDIISQKREIGDRSQRDDDRYLFLESILSARDRLFISYIGHDIKTNTELPPSTVVSELQDFIDRMFEFPGGNSISALTLHHPLKSFSDVYFSAGSRFFTYTANPVQRREDQRRALFESCSSDFSIDEISLDDLLNFFENPARFYLKNRLSLSLADTGSDAQIGERFSITNSGDTLYERSRHAVQKRMIDAFVHSNDTHAAKEYLAATPALPFGRLGDILLDKCVSNPSDIFLKHAEMYRSAEKFSERKEARINGILVRATISTLTAEGDTVRYVFEPTVRSKHILSAWILHLFTSLFTEMPSSRLVSFNEKNDSDKSCYAFAKLLPLDALSAQKECEALLDIFVSFMRQPFPLFPRDDFAFTQEILNAGDDLSADECAQLLLVAASKANDADSRAFPLWQDQFNQFLFQFDPDDALDASRYAAHFNSSIFERMKTLCAHIEVSE